MICTRFAHRDDACTAAVAVLSFSCDKNNAVYGYGAHDIFLSVVGVVTSASQFRGGVHKCAATEQAAVRAHSHETSRVIRRYRKSSLRCPLLFFSIDGKIQIVFMYIYIYLFCFHTCQAMLRVQYVYIYSFCDTTEVV